MLYRCLISSVIGNHDAISSKSANREQFVFAVHKRASKKLA